VGPAAYCLDPYAALATLRLLTEEDATTRRCEPPE
jgi:hypothetical protein